MTINNRRELFIARACTFASLITIVGLFHFLFIHAETALAHHRWHALLETVVFATVMFFLAYSNLLYQICLVGYYTRGQKHRHASRPEIESLYSGDAPSLSILVPSYKEEYSVNLQTLVSAALAEYPHKQVVLLIDDPRSPRAREDIDMLERSRSLAPSLQQLFDVPHQRYMRELEAFRLRAKDGRAHGCVELNRLAILYDNAADWLEALAADYVKDKPAARLTHVDTFYLETVIGRPIQAHRERAKEYRARVNASPMALKDIELQYQRLASLFNVRFSSFERKKYANLSHEANKAMNLNSYIGLIGKSWKEVQTHDGMILQECGAADADFTIPAADYVNTIDADSMMVSDYCLRLVHLMEQPQNSRIAVVQSPCSAYPNAKGSIERVAGAAIDIQYQMHQGYTHWNATFWVGANAMLRSKALEQIREERVENGYPVSVFIQDRTVIEDTESSIDLVHKGWQLCNYPARMTFSSMPSDFGSLLIQRRRWANGGLLILPKLFSYMLRAPKRAALLKELFMRFHYLASTASGCLVMLLYLFYPFSDKMGTIWIPLSTLPCFALYARDLRNAGYKIPDFLRICALNFMLQPVIMGGLLKSLQQAATGRKIPFVRTPKVPGRTVAPALYSLIVTVLPFVCLGFALHNMYQHRMANAASELFDSALYFYALAFMIGIKAALEDIAFGAKGSLRAAFASADGLLAPVRRILLTAPKAERN